MTRPDPNALPPRDYPAWTPQPFVGVRAIAGRPNPAPCHLPPGKKHPRQAERTAADDAEDVGD